MKDFDLEAAKRGAAVCTRDGKPVRILCFNRAGSMYPIIALRTIGESEAFSSYTEDGGEHVSYRGDADLMMLDDDYLERLERGEYGDHIKDKLGMVAPTCEDSLQVGLTKREWFAGMVMAGIFAGRNWPHEAMIPDCINCARNSVELADALMAELEKKN